MGSLLSRLVFFASHLWRFLAHSSDGTAKLTQGVPPEVAETPLGDDTTEVALTPSNDNEENHSTFKTSNSLDNHNNLELTISSEREDVVALPGHPASVIDSSIPDQASQEKQGHSPESHQDVSHPEETTEIVNQPISSTSEVSLAHNEAETLLSHSPHTLPEAQVECNVPNPLVSQAVAEEQVAPSVQLANVVPVNPEADISKKEIYGAELRLFIARTSYAEFKAKGNPGLLDLAISWYQTALALTPPKHADWVTVALERAEALEDSQRVNNEVKETTPPLDEAIKLYEQVLCSTSDDMECEIGVVSRLSRALRLRHELKGREHSPGRVWNRDGEEGPPPGHAVDPAGGKNEDFNKDDKNGLAFVSLSSAREYLFAFKTESDPKILDLAISSYRVATRLLPSTHPDWVVASLELINALQAIHASSHDEPSGSHLDEAIEIGERALAFLPEHSGDRIKVASRLRQVLQLRYGVERNDRDLPETSLAEIEEYGDLSSLLRIDGLEEGHAALSDDERSERATFHLDAARDTLLTYRAEGYKESADLQRAISSYRSAVSLMVPTGSLWVAACLELCDALEEMNYKDSNSPGCDVYREEAIRIYKHMLHAIPDNEEDHKEALRCLLWALIAPNPVDELQVLRTAISPYMAQQVAGEYTTFKGNQDPRLLDKSIFWSWKLRHLLLGSPSLLVLALLDRYGINTTPDVRLLEEALWINDLVQPTVQQPELAIILLVQIAIAAVKSQLQPDASIRLLRTTLDAAQRITGELFPPSHLGQFAEIRRCLAAHLLQRYRVQTEHAMPHHMNDLDESIAHQTEVLRCYKVLNHPERAHVSGDLARLWFLRRTGTSNAVYSDQEIEYFRDAVFGCGIHRPVCRAYITNFLDSLSLKAHKTGDPEFAEEMRIHCDEIVVHLRSGDIDDETANMIQTIGEIKGRLQSTEGGSRLLAKELKKELRQAEHLTRDKLVEDGPGAAIALLGPSAANLQDFFLTASQLLVRYIRTGEPNLGERAEAMWRQLEDFAKSSNDPHYAWLTHFGPCVRARILVRRDPSSRHVALRDLETIVENAKLAPDSELDPDTFRLMLDTLLQMKLKDPQESLRDFRRNKPLIFQQPYPARPNDPPSAWGLRLTTLLAHADHRGFMDSFEEELREMGFEDLESMAEVIRGSLTQLHHLAQVSPSTQASLQAIQREDTAASSLSSFVLLAPVCNTHIGQETPTRLLEIAVTTLESLRTIVWTQATRRRHPADKVAEVNPELASRFRELSHTLNNPIQNRGHLHDFIHPLSSQSVDASSSATAAKTLPRLITRGIVQREWDDVVDQIRCLPGFEDFLRLKSFAGLRQVASEGPIVILAAAPRLPKFSFAFIISRATNTEEDKEKGSSDKLDYFHLPLKVDSRELESLRQRLRVSLGGRNRRLSGPQTPRNIGKEPRADVNTSNASPAERIQGGAGTKRAGKMKRKVAESVESVLSTLWTKVAQPVVEHLTKMKKPGINNRRRIWWCPTGPFAFMPIHAAGTEDRMSNVSDFFVSSYTPTLNALIQARERPIPSPESTKVLAAIQPNPGNGWSPLPDTRAELEEVHKFVPSQHLISLSSPPAHPEQVPPLENSATRDIDSEGIHTTCANILSHLPAVSVLHLACHGHQNKSDPLLNGFVLRNKEKLTVEMLMRSQEEAGPGGRCIAVLSACDTAAIDAGQPDEMINLANAMLFVGFRSVLATMWPMADPDGPRITRAIYSELFSPEVGGDLTKFCLATVLDHVMRGMRKAGEPWERWATFIHIGA